MSEQKQKILDLVHVHWMNMDSRTELTDIPLREGHLIGSGYHQSASERCVQ